MRTARTNSLTQIGSVGVGRWWWVVSVMVLVLMSLSAAGWAGQAKSKKNKKDAADNGGAVVRNGGEQTSMQLTNIRTQVMREGEIRESIHSEWARMDEADRILRMRNLRLEFYDQGHKQGTVTSGLGTLWLMPQPDKGIGRNDLELNHGVTYYSNEGWELASPRMYFNYQLGLLKSDSGYVKKLRMGNQLIRGTGQGFEVKLLLERGKLESMSEYGSPVVYEKIDESKTVIKP